MIPQKHTRSKVLRWTCYFATRLDETPARAALRLRWYTSSVVFRLPLILALVLAGCEKAGTPVPPPNPTTVELVNQSGAPVFVAGNELPFSIVDGEGTRWKAAPGAIEILCDACWQSCGVFKDPAPVYIEIPSGKSYPIAWDGRLYDRIDRGCSCPERDLDCYVRRPLPLADYTFEVQYTDGLPLGDPLSPRQYTQSPHTGGTILWVEQAVGLETLDLLRTFAVSYGGQTTIQLAF